MTLSVTTIAARCGEGAIVDDDAAGAVAVDPIEVHAAMAATVCETRRI